jgi:hypothetical protein
MVVSGVALSTPFSESTYFPIVIKLKFSSDFRIIRRKTAKFFLNSGISELFSKTWMLNKPFQSAFWKGWARQASYGCILLPWIPHAVWVWLLILSKCSPCAAMEESFFVELKVELAMDWSLAAASASTDISITSAFS